MQTICGIDLRFLANKPTPEELGAVVAHMHSDDQALFLISLGEELRNCCGGHHFMQWQAISDSIKQIEEKLCDGSASQLIDELQQRLVMEAA